MSAPLFRQAVRGDVAAISALRAGDELGRGRETASPDVYLEAFDRMSAQPGNSLVVGVIEDEIVACYQLTLIEGLSRGGARRAQIEAVRVAPGRRGAGIGHLVMRDAEARARAAGCALVQLSSDRSREAAHAFDESLGYEASHLGFKRSLRPDG
ncbi:GNAT family N-acetyltransferase [Limimaricola sp. G21655-S1]|uniref:GNAT family N-acetyltransferase n=1 Tax=Limimaricola sp. G21655-S1 TaxID=3014768 RepID=UPI0022AE59CB|nr:GNAT family N-acetyltransferase [Limimaricola sp. G21655-S1]